MNIIENIKKGLAIAPVISAMVGLVDNAEGISGEQKKGALLSAWNAVEKSLGFDWDDKYVSIAIEVIYALGKFVGTLKSSGAPTPALPGNTSKTS